ncbi:Hypothetical predicted protein, partial [Paramuricea clavata]
MDISIQTRELLERLFNEKLKPVLTNINDVRGKLDEVIHSMDFLSSQYDVIEQKFTKSEEVIKETNQENQRLKNEVSRLTIKVQEQRDIANDLEQYIRRDCLEIKGIPQREGENTDSLVMHLANELGVDVKDEDISHRLPTSYSTRQNQDPMIIVKFTGRNIRDRFYQSRKGLRGKATRNFGLSKVAENPIFI